MKIAIKFLGSGWFAEPIKELLAKRFELVEENPDLQVVANYGRILTKQEIEAPKYGTLNIHPSCLPKYRGSTPLQQAILAGDKETCVCIIKMVEKVDAGSILGCTRVDINPDETLETLIQKTSKIAKQLLPLVIIQYISGAINPQKQDESGATQVKRLTREDGLLDLSKPTIELERQIRAYHPWPGSFLMLKNKRLIIHKAHIELNRMMFDIVQLEGKTPIGWQEFKRGYRGSLPII